MDNVVNTVEYRSNTIVVSHLRSPNSNGQHDSNSSRYNNTNDRNYSNYSCGDRRDNIDGDKRDNNFCQNNNHNNLSFHYSGSF